MHRRGYYGRRHGHFHRRPYYVGEVMVMVILIGEDGAIALL